MKIFEKPLAWLQPAILIGSLLPFVLIALQWFRGALGANPIATAMNQLGLLALIFLIGSLLCTPLKVVFGWTWAMRVRKTLGLLCFFTALAHFATYLVLDQALIIRQVLADVVKRPFIAFGFSALVLLTPVALTSSKDSPKKLGFKRWKRIHYLVYPAALLGCIHFMLRVKADATEPTIYVSLLGVLFLVRIVAAIRDSRRARARALEAAE